jgi:hypothetical protein
VCCRRNTDTRYRVLSLAATAMRGILSALVPGGNTMNRVLTVVALSGVIFVGARALAADSMNQSTMSKRQLFAQIVGCMKKRMSANKNSSYNEAMKACKEQIRQQNDNLPSDALVASDTAANR